MGAVVVSRPPCAPLRPFFERLWSGTAPPAADGASRERVLPTGTAHIAIRTEGPPFRFYAGPHDTAGRSFGHAVVGGMRSAPYFKDVSTPSAGVGAVVRPGAAAIVFDVDSAETLANRHTPLGEIWGEASMAALRDGLLAIADPTARLDALERALLARLPRIRGVDPRIAAALTAIGEGEAISGIVTRSGHSHRHFLKVFRTAVGLSPKLYSRVVRLGRTIESLSPGCPVDWAGLAAEAGYADQSHFIRDFRAHTGLAPRTYLQRRAGRTYHVAD
jgi:AraC-like DNA-binding protein